MISRVYKARRDKDGCSVTVNGAPLPLAEPPEEQDDGRQISHFAWGDDSQEAQCLAYSILHDYAPSYAQSPQIRRAFHEDFIKQLRNDEWQLTDEELQEGISFWTDMMRIAPPVVAGEPVWRVPIPAFIYKTFIKRAKLSGGTVKPEEVDQAVEKLGEMQGRAAMMRSAVAETATEYAPLLLPAK